MQLELSILRIKHRALTEWSSTTNITVVVGYWKGTYAVMKAREWDAVSLGLTDNLWRDDIPHRVRNLRTGTAAIPHADREEPWPRIASDILKYAKLNDDMDHNGWEVEARVPLLWGSKAFAQEGVIEAAKYVVKRLWSNAEFPPQRHGGVGLGNSSRGMNRVLAVFDNMFQRVRGTPEFQTGLLTRTNDILWKGQTFNGGDAMYTHDKYEWVKRRELYRKVGHAFGLIQPRSKAPDADKDDAFEFLESTLTNQSVMRNTPLRIASMWEVLLAGTPSDVVRCACGHFAHADDTQTIRGGQARWCHTCFTDRAVYVEDVDEYWDRDDAYFSDEDDAYYSYDREAGGSSQTFKGRQSIYDYATNPLHVVKYDRNLTSSPWGDFLMGLEVEVVPAEYRDRAEIAYGLQNQMGTDYVTCKEDASLPDGGFELVTAPRYLKTHIEKLKMWTPSGLTAWDNGECGTHVHIHSKAFTPMSLGKFLMFVNAETNADFIRKIAGRHPIKDPWAREYCQMEGQDIIANPNKALKGSSKSRYRMVNLENLSAREAERLAVGPDFDGEYDTVELRIFRASLRMERLLAQVEFAHALVGFSRVASWRDLTPQAFLMWLDKNRGLYPNLAEWFGMRKPKKAPAQDQCPDKVEGEIPPEAKRQLSYREVYGRPRFDPEPPVVAPETLETQRGLLARSERSLSQILDEMVSLNGVGTGTLDTGVSWSPRFYDASGRSTAGTLSGTTFTLPSGVYSTTSTTLASSQPLAAMSRATANQQLERALRDGRTGDAALWRQYIQRHRFE